MKRAAFLLTILLLPLTVGCGWRLVGTGSSLDPGIKTIAIPSFDSRLEIDELHTIMTSAVVNEFVRRGRHKIVAVPTEADAVLEGTIIRLAVRNTELDSAGRASRAELFVVTNLVFRDRNKDEIVWERQNFLFSQEFEVSASSTDYLEQDVQAMEELSAAFAASVVSSILEGF